VPSVIRKHAWTGLVAAATLVAALGEGLFAPLGFAAAAGLVWGVIAVCVLGRVFEFTSIGRLALLAGLLLAISAGLALLSTLWAKDQGRAFEEGVRVALYLGVFALAVCTSGEDARRRWVAGLATGLAITGFVALFAYFQPGTLDSGRSVIPNAAGRLSYPIGYWNGAAALLAMSSVLLAFCAANAATRLLRSLATAAMPAMVLAVWFTSSRGGLIALAAGWLTLFATSRTRGRLLKTILLGGVGGMALVVISGQLDAVNSGALDSARRSAGDWMSLWTVLGTLVVGAIAWATSDWTPRVQISRRLAVAMLAVVLVGGGIALALIDPAKKIDDFTAAPPQNAPVGVVGVNSNGRWQFWKSAADAFESSPVHGLGAGGWEAYWGAHSNIPRFARNPHSLPMESAAELGVPGIVLLLGFVAAVFLAAMRRLRRRIRGDAPVLAGVLVAASIGAATDWTWQIPGVIAPALVCAGLLTATAPPEMRHGRALAAPLTLVCAWLALAASALVLVGDIELRRSRSAADAGNTGEAIDRALDAHRFTPWASAPYTQLALLREDEGNYPVALADLHEAQVRDVDDWRLLLIEARLQSKSGNEAAAGTALRRARANSPFSAGSRPK
jgi:hypothetical protein